MFELAKDRPCLYKVLVVRIIVGRMECLLRLEGEKHVRLSVSDCRVADWNESVSDCRVADWNESVSDWCRYLLLLLFSSEVSER